MLPTGIIFLPLEVLSLRQIADDLMMNYHSVRVSGNVFFPFSGYLHRVCNYKLHLFSFSIFNVSFHCEKLAISLIAILLKVTFLP